MKKFIITRRITLLSFLLFATNAIALTYYGKMLEKYSETSKLDFQIGGYNDTIVKTLFAEYGSQGRQTYFWLTLLDIPFPFLVAFFGVCYFGITWNRWRYKIIWIILIITLLSFFAFDNLENIIVCRMLYYFPNINKTEVAVSSFCTQVKLISLLVIYIAIPTTFLIDIFKKFRNSKT